MRSHWGGATSPMNREMLGPVEIPSSLLELDTTSIIRENVVTKINECYFFYLEGMKLTFSNGVGINESISVAEDLMGVVKLVTFIKSRSYMRSRCIWHRMTAS